MIMCLVAFRDLIGIDLLWNLNAGVAGNILDPEVEVS